MEPLPDRIKTYLAKADSGTITEQEVGTLIGLTINMVESYLFSIRDSLAKLCDDQGLTVSDLALDCVAEVFSRDEQRRFPELDGFARSLDGPISALPAINIFRAYRSYLNRVGSAHRARLYAISDPGGASILRNVRDCLKSMPAFTAIRRVRGIVIIPSGVPPLFDHPQFPSDELGRVFMARCSGARTTRDLLLALHAVLTDQTTYRRSIHLDEVVPIFKLWYSQAGAPIPDEGIDLVADGLTHEEIENIRHQVEEVLKQKLITTYLIRRKVTRAEAEIMFKTLSDILDDWIGGAASQSIISYLRKYRDLDEATYDRDWRPKLQYLVKIAKEEFRIRLESHG